MNELEALLALTHIPLLGSIKIRLLLQHFGSAIEAFKADCKAIKELPGFGNKILQAWEVRQKQTIWQQTVDLAHQHQTTILCYTQAAYPKPLFDLIDFPLILYVKGNVSFNQQRHLAIVGTRNATLYGLEMAKKISRELAEANFTIVSGLARGIDTAAHQGALEKGKTIAILGSGIAQLYPQENKQLANRIAENGAMISEFSMATPPDRTNFPQRNRLVSGLSLGTILIEAPKQSGAMLTMERALSQGKKIFALPGRVDQENFRGNHELIKKNKAFLIENSQDVLAHFDNLFTICKPKSIFYTPPLEKEEEKIVKYLEGEELSIEDIRMKMQIPIERVNVLLMSLVLKKVIKEYPGKIYKKILIDK
jgi:DNA processing protein